MLRLPLIVCIAGACFGQAPPAQPAQTPTRAPERVSLSEVAIFQVPSLPMESVVAPLVCDPDGGILFRLATPGTGLTDPVSVSSDGKNVIQFGRGKINDISEPVLHRTFLARSELYALVRGSMPLNRGLKLQTPGGKAITQQATESHMFIVRFERDGSYSGAVPLDLPFEPYQIGVFTNGDFLIAGAESGTYSPRIAIVGSNGQLRRFVELKGDVHVQEDSDRKGKDPTALPRLKSSNDGIGASLRDVVMTSEIAQDGSNLLLFRHWSSPIFSISPSGEVRVHKLKVAESNYRLFTIKVTRTSWIAEFLRELPSGDEEFATFAFEPESGKPIREYFFPHELGWGLACTDGNEFSFVMANPETKNLKIVKLAPSVK
jgi:hypothetical protein